jgi:hypothetical protein
MSNRLSKPAGLIITALLSLAVLSAFYGNLFNKLNRVCFAPGGDGMQSFINMDYHIRVDTAYMRCNSMNYPYGEHIFFTNNQPLISNTIKFVSRNIADISDYTLGILNFTMLFCLVIAPLILFLIFTELEVASVIAILASLGITYLSPQIDRFGGHFNLSYVCVIPLMIILVLRFFKKPGFLLTGLIFLTAMAAALTHFYFYGFLAALLLFFYGAYLAGNERIFPKKYMWAVHLFLQLILPFLILQVFYISDHVTDRPAYPWGFLYYRAYPQSIFLPFNKPYGQFLHHLLNTRYINWEGFAFVGTMATTGMIIFLVRSVTKAIKGHFREITDVTSNKQLNILFWTSFVLLLYSFGLPFILGLEWLIDLIGPVRQMRGIARFSWLFYYVMNIVTIYWLWEGWKNARRKHLALLLMILAFLVFFYDAYYMVKGRGKSLENNIPALVDRNLREPENQWIKRHDLSRYQALIPLPYYHIGSENIWIDGGCDIVPASFIAIKNSKLPGLGVMLSRTSISQTVENVSLMLGPPSNALHLERFPSEKPFLLMAARCDMLSEHERQMISRSHWIDSTGKFDLYEMPFRAFRDIADSIARAVIEEYNRPGLFDHSGFKSTDSITNFLFQSFDNTPNEASYEGPGCYQGKAKEMNEVFSGKIHAADTALTYVLSFWLNNIRSDLYARTSVILTEKDISGNVVFHKTYQASRNFTMIAGNWALVTLEFRLKSPENVFSAFVQNKTLRNKSLQIDNLLIAPRKEKIYMKSSNGLFRNNSYFLKSIL